jgi:hypothetical protein
MLRRIYVKKPQNLFKIDVKQLELYLHNLQQSSIDWEKYYNGVNIRRKEGPKKKRKKVIS